MTFTNLGITFIFGFLAAGLTLGFHWVIVSSDNLRLQFPFLVLGMPLLLLITVLLKRQTLYYPNKIKDLSEMNQPRPFFWNRWMAIYHFLGASLSHLFGASVGRESVVVMVTTGMARLLNLNLSYWGPVAASIGFSTIVGSKWVSVVFMIEMYTTKLSQKIWAFTGSWIAILILQSYQFPHLLKFFDVPESQSYFRRFIFIILLGVVAGYLGRFYKKWFYYLSDLLSRKNLAWSFLISVFVGIILFNDVLRPAQSLSLDLLSRINSGSLVLQLDMQIILVKFILTLLCISLGFFGGEYVPLVVVGAGLGATMAQFFGESLLLGSGLGAFALFAAVTQLKWTALILCAGLMDVSMYFWIYLFYSVCVSFSGEKSIYKTT